MHRNRTTQVAKIIHAAPSTIYQAYLNPKSLAVWRVPDNMTARVHTFDARESGAYRMTLAYKASEQSPGGKTTENEDTFAGKFLELVPNEKIVELIQFDSDDPAFAGGMTMTTRLLAIGETTEVTIICENIPQGIRLDDNEVGCRQALESLAKLVE